MRTSILLFSLVWILLETLFAGTIHIDPICPPKKIHIKIFDDTGKTIIDHTLENPKDQTPIQYRLDWNKSYRFSIVPEESLGVLCTFQGAKGDILPKDPDLVCVCTGSPRERINAEPGKWHCSTRWEFHQTPPPVAPPTPSTTECVRDTETYFSINRLGAIKADQECPYTKKVQGSKQGEWIREGGNCYIHGHVEYRGDRVVERIFYKGGETSPDFTIHINCKRLGPCD